MKILLQDPNVNPNINCNPFYGDTTLLHVCAGDKLVQPVKMLLEHPKTEINLKTTQGGGYTPLHFLLAINLTQIDKTTKEIVAMFCEHSKINIHIKNKNGNTPLEQYFIKVDEFNKEKRKNSENKLKVNFPICAKLISKGAKLPDNMSSLELSNNSQITVQVLQGYAKALTKNKPLKEDPSNTAQDPSLTYKI